MLNYEDYFNELLKMNSQMFFMIKKPKVFKHYTNELSDDYLTNLNQLTVKYAKTKDLELKRLIKHTKQLFKLKSYLYMPITSYENEIIIFNNENSSIYPKKYTQQRQTDFHIYVKTIIERLKEGLTKKISIPYIIVKKLIIEFKELKDYNYLYKYLKNEYLAKSIKKIGLCNLPNGKKIYKLLVKNCVDKTPEYVHNQGLSLLSSIKKSKSRDEYYKTREEFFEDCVKLASIIYNEFIDKYFYYKPDKPFKIVKVVEALETSFPLAYYTHLDDAIFINLRYYKECTKKSVHSLLLHECMHQYHYRFMHYHKLKDYQIYGYDNLALVEGFAHYMEIYNDPEEINNDYYTILRILRLVADTGVNYYNWSYKKTFNFMKKYLPKNTDDIISEIDRYICIPGQALCYTIGKMEIIKLRDAYLKKNKDKTIKDFHHELLINGTCSISTIKKLIL